MLVCLKKEIFSLLQVQWVAKPKSLAKIPINTMQYNVVIKANCLTRLILKTTVPGGYATVVESSLVSQPQVPGFVLIMRKCICILTTKNKIKVKEKISNRLQFSCISLGNMFPCSFVENVSCVIF